MEHQQLVAPQFGIGVAQASVPKINPRPVAKPAPKRIDPIEELSGFIVKAASFEEWLWVTDRFVQLGFKVPSKLVYEALKKCPEYYASSTRNLRKEMLIGFGKAVFDQLTAENIGAYERRFMSLIQAASFVGRGELLTQKVLVTLAYKLSGVPMPSDLKARISACERFHGRYTPEELTSAGYVANEDGLVRTFVHPETRESVTVHIRDDRMLSEEERAKARAMREGAKAARNEMRAQERLRMKGAGGSKKQEGGSAKSSGTKKKK